MPHIIMRFFPPVFCSIFVVYKFQLKNHKKAEIMNKALIISFLGLLEPVRVCHPGAVDCDHRDVRNQEGVWDCGHECAQGQWIR